MVSFRNALVAALGLVATVANAAPTLLPRAGDVVPDQYIVVLKDSFAADKSSVASHLALLDSEIKAALPTAGAKYADSRVTHTFASALRGYSGKFPPSVAAKLAEHPDVAYVEPEQIYELTATQPNAPWGLARISAADAGPTTYSYPDSAGVGVDIYIIDSGIRTTHVDFGGRARFGFSSVAGTTDTNGHGTHVAGTAAGTTYGVAKRANLIDVKVFGTGTTTTTAAILSGIDWVRTQYAAQTVKRPSVANLSLGGPASTALDTAITNLINAGVTAVIASGNNGANVANTSPARVTAAITVAASSITDAFGTFSNVGAAVDIIAPGVSVVSTSHTSDTGTRTLTGTSMACPHVAGAAALVLAAGRATTPAQVQAFLKSNAVANTITGVPASNVNSFLFVSSTW